MLISNINIIPFDSLHKQAIDQLMESIQVEFSEPISSNGNAKNILPPDLYLVALVGNKFAGTISITKLENNNAVLRKMFMHKEYRGHGIAAMLLQKIVNWSLENHVQTIYLGTMIQFLAAQKFYEKQHFVKITVEQLPPDFPINPIDSVFYKLKLKTTIKQNL